eukprot:g6476.t1
MVCCCCNPKSDWRHCILGSLGFVMACLAVGGFIFLMCLNMILEGFVDAGRLLEKANNQLPGQFGRQQLQGKNAVDLLGAEVDKAWLDSMRKFNTECQVQQKTPFLYDNITGVPKLIDVLDFPKRLLWVNGVTGIVIAVLAFILVFARSFRSVANIVLLSTLGTGWLLRATIGVLLTAWLIAIGGEHADCAYFRGGGVGREFVRTWLNSLRNGGGVGLAWELIWGLAITAVIVLCFVLPTKQDREDEERKKGDSHQHAPVIVHQPVYVQQPPVGGVVVPQPALYQQAQPGVTVIQAGGEWYEDDDEDEALLGGDTASQQMQQSIFYEQMALEE